jgi:hypothetical protein
MYVDDSGTPSMKDIGVNYYVISGVIIKDKHLVSIDNLIRDCKKRLFVGPYANEEIHIHDIYKGKTVSDADQG